MIRMVVHVAIANAITLAAIRVGLVDPSWDSVALAAVAAVVFAFVGREKE